MPEDGKKSGMMAQIFVAVVIALCVGGSSPWWFKELFLSPKPEMPLAEVNRPIEAKTVSNEELSKLDKSDLASRQQQLEKELAELRSEQKENPQPQSVRRQTTSIGGAWQGGGSTYTIYQNGTDLTIEEFSSGYGRTAVGEGTISGSTVTLRIQTALGSQGTLSMTLSDDGQLMTGTYTDHTFGSQAYYEMSR